MGSRQEHEKVVAAARDDMARFDGRRVLERWLQNFVDPGLTIGPQQWCTVVKAAERGWTVEIGTEDDGPTPAPVVYKSDPSAPQPPVMEIRPPKPEPVKPRFNVPEPRKVGANDWLYDLRRDIDEKLFKDLYLGTFTTTEAPPEKTLTATALRMMMDTAEREFGRGFRRRAIYPTSISLDYDESRPTPFRYETIHWGSMLRSPAAIIGVDLGSKPSETVVHEFKKPPPETSVRNK